MVEDVARGAPRRRGRPPTAGLADVRREQIVASAYTIFAERGYEATAISDIARHAGIGQGTVYRYFESKRQILDHVFDHALEKLATVIDLEAVVQPVESIEDFVSRVRSGVAQVPAVVESNPELLKLVFVEASARDPEATQRLLGIEAMVAAALATTLEFGQSEGWIRADLDAVAYSHLILSLAIPGLMSILDNGGTPDVLDRYTDTMLSILVPAIQAGR